MLLLNAFSFLSFSPIYKNTHETTSDRGAFIFNGTLSPGGFGVIVQKSWLGAAEPCTDKVGGARVLHLPAVTVPHFSVSIFEAVRGKGTELAGTPGV